MSKLAQTESNELSLKEYPELMWTNLVVKKRNFFELLKVASRYYSTPSFMRIDTAVLRKYWFNNPFRISKEFLKKRGESDVYAYGETPLTTMDLIAKECGISKKDTVFELGCGRGRTCFWLNAFLGCRVVGIEYIPQFVKKADEIVNKYQVKNVEFRLEDLMDSDLTGATVIYLYGTCYGAPFINKLCAKLAKLPAGTKIITVSYPLTDYTNKNDFEVMKRFTVPFTWGNTDVYLQLKH